jgi:hypothetical protein
VTRAASPTAPSSRRKRTPPVCRARGAAPRRWSMPPKAGPVAIMSR